MKRPPAPTPAEQIAFLGTIERLLSEGQCVATYKYALLIAIADLAVQTGSQAAMTAASSNSRPRRHSPSA